MTDHSPTPFAGQVPPHDLQAEGAALGALMLNPDALIDVAEQSLSPADFYRPAHGHIFDAIQTLSARGEPIDAITVAGQLDAANLLETIGGHATLIDLQAETPATSNAGHYAAIVTRNSRLRRLISTAREIIDTAMSSGQSQAEDVIPLRSESRRVAAKAGGIDLIVIDYLQLMDTTGTNNAATREREVAAQSRGLKLLAKELNVPVVCLAQVNRGVEHRVDKRPSLADLRESGAIEADADTVTFLYRDEIYNNDSPDRGLAELIVAKHRAGPTGTVKVAFLPQFTSFENLARPGTF